MTGRAIFTDAYAVIPRGCFSDIVTSFLPFWTDTRFWVLSRPLSGFAETFSQYIGEVAPGGGSDRPELDKSAEAVLFVVSGTIEVTIEGETHVMSEGGYAYLPPACVWTLHNKGDVSAKFHWIRKAYEFVDGLEAPEAFVTNENDVTPSAMPGTEGKWATSRFVDMADMRHDMHVTIVTLQPGAVIPFAETHVMEHGLYVLEDNLKDPAFEDKMVRFVRASMKGWKYAEANSDEAAMIVLENDETGAQTETHQKRMMGEIAKLTAGSIAVVFGAGGVGLNAIQGCAIAGAAMVIAVDRSDHKLAMARLFGATHTVNAAAEDNLVKTLKKLTGGGADYAFECVGLGSVVAQAYGALRKGGTAVVTIETLFCCRRDSSEAWLCCTSMLSSAFCARSTSRRNTTTSSLPLPPW